MGGIDVDPVACADFEKNVKAPAYPLDMFTYDQFVRFHSACPTSRKKCRVCGNTGKPPPGWSELTGQKLLRLFGYQFPNMIFFSAPCKGFSSLLNPKTANGVKYQALNELVPRGIQLAMGAWGEKPPGLIIMENVPRIATRGRALLEQVIGLLNKHGYAVRETEHDCGVIGGLGQKRRRFLLVARHKATIKPFLYEPPKLPLRGVGEVVGDLPLPGTGDGGPLHELPRLQWITWLRLALIEAGKDWRHLHQLDLEDRKGPKGEMGKYLKHIGIEPLKDWHRGVLGVNRWSDPASTVTGNARPGTGAFAIADPKTKDYGKFCSLGIQPLDKASPTVTGQSAPGTGYYSIPDPRLGCDADNKQTRRFNNVYRLVRWDQPVQAVTGGMTPTSGGQAVADPRFEWGKRKTSYQTGGHYGVLRWDQSSDVVSGHAKHDRGKFSIQDPRGLPDVRERCVPLIIALDGCWHRPLTLLELGCLQGYPLTAHFGGSKSQVREHIGNSVPPPAGEAMGNQMLETLLRAHLEQSVQLDQRTIWVRDSLDVVLSLPDPDELKFGLEVGP